MKLITYDELTATPWKNGGGVTRELACWPASASLNDFVWRVSIADVSQSGPFSIFPGIDRVITLLQGDGMDLQFPQGSAHALTTTLEPYRFRGEAHVDAHLIGSPSRDFNVMLRRGAAHGDIDVKREHSTIPGNIAGNIAGTTASTLDGVGTTLLLFCAAGSWHAAGADGAEQTLKPGDSLLIENPTGETAIAPLHADSALLCVRITLLQANQ
jgi:environmental stress-induced protein Ves